MLNTEERALIVDLQDKIIALLVEKQEARAGDDEPRASELQRRITEWAPSAEKFAGRQKIDFLYQTLSGRRQSYLNLGALLLQGQKDRGVAFGPAAGHSLGHLALADRREAHRRLGFARQSSARPRSLPASASEKRARNRRADRSPAAAP